MSAHDHEEHSPEDTRHHEPFDPTPVTEAAPGEPNSPMWLPVLGAALFACVGIWWLTGSDAPAAENVAITSASASASASAVAPKPPSASARAVRTVAPRPRPAPNPSGAAKLTPEQLRKRRDAIRKLRAAKKAP